MYAGVLLQIFEPCISVITEGPPSIKMGNEMKGVQIRKIYRFGHFRNFDQISLILLTGRFPLSEIIHSAEHGEIVGLTVRFFYYVSHTPLGGSLDIFTIFVSVSRGLSIYVGYFRCLTAS